MMKNINALVAASMILYGGGLGFAQGVAPTQVAHREPVKTMIPSVAIDLKTVEEEFVILMVDKGKLTAKLLSWPSEFEKAKVLEKFTVAIGKEKGDKVARGDNRTPEGVYFTLSTLDGEKLPAKYGPNAITLNYPNPIDRAQGKTGYGIWLHGVIKDERVEEANVTEGCIAFYNSDIIRLTQWLRPNQGVVVIAEDLRLVNKEEDIKKIQSLTQEWIKAWQNRDLPRYIGFYAQDFSTKGMNLSDYQSYKKRVFDSYRNMSVNVSQLRVVTHPKYAVSIMNQDFNGDNRFISNGRKILYWVKNQQGQWKIQREIFDHERVQLVRYGYSDQGKALAVYPVELNQSGS